VAVGRWRREVAKTRSEVVTPSTIKRDESSREEQHSSSLIPGTAHVSGAASHARFVKAMRAPA
jgi:hypothetical protein